MKKSDLLLAGAMLFGFGATAQAQEQLFFFGFEDGVASFTDSANAPDSITEVQFYSHIGSNANNLKPEEFEFGPKVDTLLYVLNGLSPKTDRGDSYDIVIDADGQHKEEYLVELSEGVNFISQINAEIIIGNTHNEINIYKKFTSTL